MSRAETSRSAIKRLSNARLPFPLDINTGIHDGHTGSVPVSHAIRAFNAVAAEADRVPAAAIEEMVRGRKVPPELGAAASVPLYASKPVLLRRTSGSTRLTVFNGGHDIVPDAGLTWLEAQRRGTAPAWDVNPHVPPVLSRPDAASGR